MCPWYQDKLRVLEVSVHDNYKLRWLRQTEPSSVPFLDRRLSKINMAQFSDVVRREGWGTGNPQ